LCYQRMSSSPYKAVLLVDDNEIDNLINQKMIEASGITEKIFVNTSAKSALEFLKNLAVLGSFGKDFFPDLLFLDIDMPLMDGYQFLDEFEKLKEVIRKKITIIMLTSSINPHDERAAKRYPFVKKFLHKPLTKEMLQSLEF
jgi:CheY-like chemotaxis protein